MQTERHIQLDKHTNTDRQTYRQTYIYTYIVTYTIETANKRQRNTTTE